MPKANGAGWVTAALRTLELAAALRVAIAGDGAGAVLVSGRPNFFHARLGDENGEGAEVRYDIVHPNHGDSILIERVQPLGRGEWRMVFWLRDETDPTLPPPIVGGGGIRPEVQWLLDDDSIQLLDDSAVELTE